MDTETIVKIIDALAAPQAEKDQRGQVTTWRVGLCYLIRTVTMTWTGRLIAFGEHELVLGDAAWIADTGRYHAATNEDALSEVEPVEGPVIIGRGSVVDAREWKSALPRTVK